MPATLGPVSPRPTLPALAALLLALGCALSHGRGEAGPTADGGSPIDPVDPGPGTRSVYALASMSAREPEGDRADGSDLDDVVSTGEGVTCVDLTPDFVSLQDGARGVDNALAPLVPTLGSLHADSCAVAASAQACLAELSTRAILAGRSLYVIEVTGIGSYEDDPAVEVIVHRATVPGCDPAVASTCAPRRTGTTLAPGQTFETRELGRGAGTIAGGRLRVSFARPVPIDIPMFRAEPAEHALHGARLVATITPESLSSAALAGALEVEEMARRAEEGMPGAGELVRSVMSGVADLDPDPEDSSRCLQLSVALSITTVPARIR